VFERVRWKLIGAEEKPKSVVHALLAEELAHTHEGQGTLDFRAGQYAKFEDDAAWNPTLATLGAVVLCISLFDQFRFLAQ